MTTVSEPRVATWPVAPWHDWADTIATIHMWTQIVGKIRMAKAPPQNHWWHVSLAVTARGLTTGPMPHGDRLFEIAFDFVDHRLVVTESAGRRAEIELRPMSVAAFYGELNETLHRLDLDVSIWPYPVEVVDSIPFEQDEQHASYERGHVSAFWAGLREAHRMLSLFRGRFIGKMSPVHFFWGGFDLAVTRFSGRTAPLHHGGVPNCPDWVMHEAYSHEVSSAGWWPLSAELGPTYYSYMYPDPPGFDRATTRSVLTHFNAEFGEFILPETALAGLADPELEILAFLQSTYESGANRAGWDRAALETRDHAGGRARPSRGRRAIT
ncbi:MAG TPA: DUF5996 family protein [Candidatus Limnocylindrales bacterium]|nr:DUF5996 family protein [Candidatus Limnocylindrales bacterium]